MFPCKWYIYLSHCLCHREEQRFLSTTMAALSNQFLAEDVLFSHGLLDIAEEAYSQILKHALEMDDKPLEVAALKAIGDVYLEKGRLSQDGKDFTKASALYNAALVRCADWDGRQSLVHRIKRTEKCFMRYVAGIRKHVPSTRREDMNRKLQLQKIRNRSKEQLETLSSVTNHSYEGNPMESEETRNTERKRTEAVRSLYSYIAVKMKQFIVGMVEECIETLRPVPCQYAMVGMGSICREEMTPYSDLEFAILVKEGKCTDQTKTYFRTLTHLLHLKVLNLGETILPSMAIKSLNDFNNKETDWYYDDTTPCGFSFDGSMPWASKTALGRDQTSSKPALELIMTPSEMAELQKDERSVKEGYHLADVLCNVTLISGNYNNQTCQMTVGDALYRTLEIPTGQSSVFLQPRIALHAGGNVVTQAESCQVSEEFYLDRRGVWPLNHIFSYSATSGPFFILIARSDGYMYIRWMGPAHLSPCLDGLVVQLAISCNSDPLQTCVSFKLDGTAVYDYQSGSSPCLFATDSTGSGSGLSPMSRTHANPVLTSQVTETPTSSRPPASNSDLAMIIGVAVGAVLALAVIGVSVAFLFYRAGKVAGRQRSTMRTNLPASARKKDGVANPAYSSQASQKGANVPPPVPPRPGEEPNYYSSADPEDIYMELDGTQQRSLYRKGTSQGGAYTSLNATSPAEKDKGDASKGPEPPAPPPVGSIPGYEGVYVEPQPGEAGLPADADYEGYIVPKSEENEYLDLNGGSSNL
ncbi:uncharacterized protein LOC144912250 isoform X1 [Branchiostoma floridae x Branchiostoma belcheri]